MTVRVSSAKELRALNQPRPVQVLVDPVGVPEGLFWRGRKSRIDFVKEQWRIDDEWWRRPISRRYFQVVLTTGVLITLYHDMQEDQWFLQGA